MYLKDDSEKGIYSFHQTTKEVFDTKELRTPGSCCQCSGNTEDKERDMLNEPGRCSQQNPVEWQTLQNK